MNKNHEIGKNKMNKSDSQQPVRVQKTDMKGLIVFNPTAGDGETDTLKAQLQEGLGEEQFDLLKLDDDMSLCTELSDALKRQSYHWVGAAGGDGTVSKVGSCLVDLELPLVIIPAGTGNAIAEALGIPEEIEKACRLPVDGGEGRRIDAIRLNGHNYFLQVGIGLEALTMQKTTSEQKSDFGELAYLWTAAKEALDWEPQELEVTIDGKRQTLEASELILANIGSVGVMDLHWGEDIKPDDGRLDVVAINARSAGDYARVITSLARGSQADSDLIKIFHAYEKVLVESGKPLPIHGDGEDLEDPWPLEARLIPGALTVIVPNS